MKKKLLSALMLCLTSLGMAQTGSISIVSIPDQIESGATVSLQFTYTSNVEVTLSAQLFQTEVGVITPDYTKYVAGVTTEVLPADTAATVTVAFKVPASAVPTAQLTDRQYTFDLKLTETTATTAKEFGYSNGTADHTVEIIPSSVPVDNISFTKAPVASVDPGTTLSVEFEYTLADSAHVKAGLAIYDARGTYLRNAMAGTEVANYYMSLPKTTTSPVSQTALIQIPATLTPSSQLAAGESYKVVITIFTTKWAYKVDQKNDIIVADVSKIADVLNTFTNEVVTVYNMQGAVITSGSAESISLESGFYILKSATKTQKLIVQ